MDNSNLRTQSGLLGRWIAFAAIALASWAVPLAAQAQTYGASCASPPGGTGCHSASPAGTPRMNAANSAAYLTTANTFQGMGFSAAFMTANAGNIATEIAAFLQGPTFHNMNYGTSATFVVNDLYADGMLTGMSFAGVAGTSTASYGGTSGGQLQVTYNAGTTCTSDSFVVAGTGAATTSNRTVSVTINDPPAPNATNGGISTINYSTGAQARSVAGLVTGTAPAVTMSVSGLSPNVGSIAATGTQTFSYTGSPTQYAPSLSVNYTVTGPCTTTSATRTVTFSVNPPPAPANGNLGPITAQQSNPININLATGITGIQNTTPNAAVGTYGIIITAQPPAGQGTVSTSPGSNTVTYTPGGAFSGATSFQYQRSGPGGTSAAGTVSLNVTASPVGQDAFAGNTPFNTPLLYDVGPLIAGTITPPVSATGAINGTTGVSGTVVTFTPTAGYFGPASFSYTATGPGGTSTPNTITLTVLPPPPTAGNTTATAAYQTATPIDVTPAITGVQTPPVTAFNAVNGTITGVVNNTVTFTPAAGFIGAASFQYNASGPGGTSVAPGTVSVTVTPPAAPVVTPFSTLVSATTPTTIDLAPLVSGIYTTFTIVTQPNAGDAVISGTMLTFTPLVGFVGTTTLQFRANGPGGPSNVAQGTLQFTTAPVTPDRVLVVPFNTPTEFELASRVSGVYSSIDIRSSPAHGTVLVRGTVMTYQPDSGYFGPDSFTYTATGTGGTSMPGTVRITVNPQVAEVQGGAVTASFNTPLQIDLARFIRGTASGFTLTVGTTHGTLTLSGTVVTYTPNPGFFGTDSFRFVANNGAGTSTEGVINITVGSVRPVASATALVVQLNTPKSLDLAPFISGSGVQGVSIPKSQSTRGTVEVNGTVITYTPKHNFFGQDSFQYIAFGNLGASAPATVNVTVEGRPDPRNDPDVTGLVDAQAQVPARFTRAQVSNFQRRMETLHRGPDSAFPEKPVKPEPPAPAGEATPPAGGGAPAPAGAPTSRAPSLDGTVPSNAGTTIPGLSPLVSSLISLATSQTVGVNGASEIRNGLSIWIAGLATFGELDNEGGRSGSRFSTDGMSVGIDKRLSDNLVLGVGGGYARDRTGVGSNGTNNKSRGSSFALYGSFQPSMRTYLDMMVGFGTIDMDSQRYVPEIGQFGTATRKVDQVFGSIAGGYEWRQDGILVSPYGRLDFTQDKFKTASESGADQYNLTFNGQTQKGSAGAIGLRAESQHEMEYGRAIPRIRVEYRREFQDDRTTVLNYADLFGGPEYSVTSKGTSRNAVLLGIGSDFLVSGGLKLGFDYTVERNSGSKNVQAVRLIAVQDLDFKDLPPFRFTSSSLARPISVDFGASYDDNVSRGRLEEEKRSDSLFSLGIGQEYVFPVGTNFRLVATPLVTGEKFRRWAGLGRFSGGLQAEVQYRSSGAFDATTLGLKGSAIYDQYESSLRTGARYFLGVNARRALTDKIDLFAEAGANRRDGKSEVFQLRDWVAKANLDYSLGRSGVVYVAGEYRKGDTFASGLPSLTNAAIADVFVIDDAFENQLVAYRLEARTVLGVVGYNRPLGPRDSLDFSYRRVQTDPSNKPSFDAGGPLKYIDNQYSIVYLLRF